MVLTHITEEVTILDVKLFVDTCGRQCEILEIIFKYVVDIEKNKLTIYGSSIPNKKEELSPAEEQIYNFDPTEYEKHDIKIKPTCIVNGEVLFFGVVGSDLLFELCRIVSSLPSDKILNLIAITGYNF